MAELVNCNNYYKINSSSKEAENIIRRYKTFVGWNGKKTAYHLAVAGFCYTGDADKVVCPACNVRLYNWRDDDDAVEMHRLYSPQCAFIKKWFDGKTVADAAYEVGNDSVPPKYPDFKKFQDRVDSYGSWPRKAELQSPPAMAAEGFFYLGSADRARCFHCGLTLRDWEDDDVPADVHRQFAPACEFVHRRKQRKQKGSISELEKGKSFEDHFKEQEEDEELGAVGGVINVDSAAHSTENSAMVAAVLEYGYKIGFVMKVIDETKRRHGKEINNASELVEALLDYQDKLDNKKR